MKLKLKPIHYVFGILVVAAILYFSNAGYFLGAVTGLCSSNDPTEIVALETDIAKWNFNDQSGQLSGNTVSWGDYKIDFVNVPGMYNTTCTNYLSALVAAAYNQSVPFASSIQRDRTVVFIEPANFYWCDQSGSILMQTTNGPLKDRFFENYVICLECHANATEMQTCPDGTNITAKLCNASGFWTYPESCSEIVVEQPSESTGNAGSDLSTPSGMPTCIEGAVYDEAIGTCVPVTAEVPKETNWWMIGAVVIAIAVVGVLVWSRKKMR